MSCSNFFRLHRKFNPGVFTVNFIKLIEIMHYILELNLILRILLFVTTCQSLSFRDRSEKKCQMIALRLSAAVSTTVIPQMRAPLDALIYT